MTASSMGNNIRSMQNITQKHAVITIGKNYFKGVYDSAETRMESVKQKALNAPTPTLYGTFSNDDQYLKALDLLVTSTLDPQHREEVILNEVISRLHSSNNLNSVLDVGVGNGYAIINIDGKFSNITIIDKSKESLANAPDKTVNKIEGSILDQNIEIYNTSYDFILLSHVLYYIPKNDRIPLLQNLHKLLNKNGVMVVAVNEEGDRAKLAEHFGSTNQGFSDLLYELPRIYDNFELYRIEEFLDGGDINSMMKIAGICLNDYGVNATEEELSDYLLTNVCRDDICQISMVQNIMVIGASSDN